jgi:CelD/BcsL family acetyltransferase involved in cellulose biosynthesis
MPKDADVKIKLVTQRQDLNDIVPAWQRLWEACGPAGTFLSPEWLLTWWDCYPYHKALTVVLVFCEKQVVGIAPWYVEERCGWRRLKTLAHGFIDYEGILVRTGMEEVVAGCLERWLRSSDCYDEANFQRLLGNNWITKKTPTITGLQSIKRCQHTSSLVIDLKTGWEQVRARLSRKYCYETERQIRRLRELGNLQLQAVESNNELTSCFADFLKWKCDRYDCRYSSVSDVYSRGGFWNAPRVAHYYREVARKLLSRNHLSFSCLTLNERPISATYGMEKNGRYYYFSNAFLPVGSFSVGRIHLWLLLQSLCQRGITDFDFLIGDEEYKRKWPVSEYRLETVQMCKNTWQHRIRRFMPVIIETVENSVIFRQFYKNLKSCL